MFDGKSSIKRSSTKYTSLLGDESVLDQQHRSRERSVTAVARLTEVDRRWVDAGRWSMDDSGYVRLYRVDRDAGDGGVSSR